MNPPKPKTSNSCQSIVIFDWDDTILPTSHLGSFGFVDLPEEITN